MVISTSFFCQLFVWFSLETGWTSFGYFYAYEFLNTAKSIYLKHFFMNWVKKDFKFAIIFSLRLHYIHRKFFFYHQSMDSCGCRSIVQVFTLPSCRNIGIANPWSNFLLAYENLSQPMIKLHQRKMNVRHNSMQSHNLKMIE